MAGRVHQKNSKFLNRCGSIPWWPSTARHFYFQCVPATLVDLHFNQHHFYLNIIPATDNPCKDIFFFSQSAQTWDFCVGVGWSVVGMGNLETSRTHRSWSHANTLTSIKNIMKNCICEYVLPIARYQNQIQYFAKLPIASVTSRRKSKRSSPYLPNPKFEDLS